MTINDAEGILTAERDSAERDDLELHACFSGLLTPYQRTDTLTGKPSACYVSC